MRLDDLPGRDEPGEMSDPPPGDMIIVDKDHVRPNRPASPKPVGTRPVQADTRNQNQNAERKNPLQDIVGKYDLAEIKKFLRNVEAEHRRNHPPQPRQRTLIRGND